MKFNLSLGCPKGIKSKGHKLSGKEEKIKMLLAKTSENAIARTLGVYRLSVAEFIKGSELTNQSDQ